MTLGKCIKFQEFSSVFYIHDGVLYRRLDSGKVKKILCKASNKRGYCQVTYKSSRYTYHRIMYCLAHRIDVPRDLVIDHLDGNKTNNDIANLRLATVRQNTTNQERHRKGFLPGVYYLDGKIYAKFSVKRNQISLGVKDTEEEAYSCYLEAAEMYRNGRSTKDIQYYFGAKVKKNTFPKGVYLDKEGRIKANICINDVNISLGTFNSVQEALKARKNAEFKKDSIKSVNRREIEALLGVTRAIIKSEFPGVYALPGGKYSARIYVSGVVFHLGRFASQREAFEAQTRVNNLKPLFRGKAQFKELICDFSF